MNMIRDYIDDSEFRLTFLENRVSIVNYLSIEHIDQYKVIVKSSMGLVGIDGLNLAIIKLVDDEVLISGIINNIKIENNEK